MIKTTTKISLVVCCFIGCMLVDTETAKGAAGVAARENLATLIKTKSCVGCDLTELNLNRMDLSGVNLEGADLSFSKLFLTNLSGASLRNTTLTGAQFGGADLGETDLRGADLRGVSLDGAYLGGAKIDGQFVTAKPFEKHGVPEVKKEVYVEDPAKPKKLPKKQEVKVSSRRDFGEPPPQLAEKQPEVKPGLVVERRNLEKAQEKVADDMVLPRPPAAKKIKKVKPVVIEETSLDTSAGRDEEEVVIAAVSLPAQNQSVGEQQQPVEETVVSTSVGDAPAQPEVRKTAAAASLKDESGVQPVKSSGMDGAGATLAADKKKRDNLTRLLDKNRCYGCDLSGLDLSGKDLEGADLEKADLTGCNLENADLEEANLKGANLQKAIVRSADLRDTDFYKADLTGADLTGSKMQGAMFDGAILTDTQGIDRLMIKAR